MENFSQTHSLSPEEIERYKRHLLLSEISEKGQKKLKKARVLVVGAGGLGSPVLLYLAAAGVGEILIADGDKVELSNLQRQVIFGEADLGKNKAQAASLALKNKNSQIQIQFFPYFLDASNILELVESVDVVVDCCDNFTTRYLINDSCVMLGKPFVYGSIEGFMGQVSLCNFKGSATYRCLFPSPNPTSLNCEEMGVLGILPAIVGSFQANEVLKVILEIGTTLENSLLIFDALSSKTQIIKYSKNQSQVEKIKSIQKEDFSCQKSSSIDPLKLKEILRQNKKGNQQKVQILDVRPFDSSSAFLEFEFTTHNIPLDILDKNSEELNQNLPVYVFCQSGKKSLLAVEKLNSLGFEAYQIEGGIAEILEVFE